MKGKEKNMNDILIVKQLRKLRMSGIQETLEQRLAEAMKEK
jgi:hypothetical protein